MAALTSNKPRDEKGTIVYENDFAYKEASTGAAAIIYAGSLLCYEAATGGLRKGAHANTTDFFAGVAVEEVSVAITAGAAAKSTLDSERVKFICQGTVKLSTATGAANTAACTALTNGRKVYLSTDNEVCVVGTGTGLILVGTQRKYVSDTEVWVELNIARNLDES